MDRLNGGLLVLKHPCQILSLPGTELGPWGVLLYSPPTNPDLTASNGNPGPNQMVLSPSRN
ncbi:hypothetical protein BP00DRAFT_431681, partial [Aspergillus indologenus CBS 114.80]